MMLALHRSAQHGIFMVVQAPLLPDQPRRLHNTHILNQLHAFLQVIDKVKEENFKRDGAHILLPL